VEKYFRVGQATDDNTTQCTAGCIPKVTDTNSEYVILSALPITAMVIRMHLSVMLNVHFLSH